MGIDSSEATAKAVGAPEVTEQMIDAGVQAYYLNAASGWENPGTRELREMLRDVFTSMSGRFRRVSKSLSDPVAERGQPSKNFAALA